MRIMQLSIKWWEGGCKEGRHILKPNKVWDGRQMQISLRLAIPDRLILDCIRTPESVNANCNETKLGLRQDKSCEVWNLSDNNLHKQYCRTHGAVNDAQSIRQEDDGDVSGDWAKKFQHEEATGMWKDVEEIWRKTTKLPSTGIMFTQCAMQCTRVRMKATRRWFVRKGGTWRWPMTNDQQAGWQLEGHLAFFLPVTGSRLDQKTWQKKICLDQKSSRVQSLFAWESVWSAMNSGEILRMTEEKYILCYQRETHTAKDDRAIYVSFYKGDSNIFSWISTK